MRHNLTPPRQGLGALRCFQAPNLFILTRAQRPPVPLLAADDSERETEAKTLAGDCKNELIGRSKKSSHNLAKALSSLDWNKLGTCFHVTLTYWAFYPDSKEELARKKQALVMSLSRHCVAGVWSLEYQTERFKKSGEWVPHWHCMLWLEPGKEVAFEAWLREWWADFSLNPSEHGVHVTSGDQARGVWYLAMHAAKAAQSPPFAVGRWWGFINRDALLGAQDLHNTGEVTDRENVWWCRLFRRSLRVKVRQRGRCAQGISWFLPRAAQCKAGAWIRDHIEHERKQRFRAKDPY